MATSVQTKQPWRYHTLFSIGEQKEIGIDITHAITTTIFSGKRLIVAKENIKRAFKQYNAKEILDIGKKQFIEILAEECDIKTGNAVKIWNDVKIYIKKQIFNKNKNKNKLNIINKLPNNIYINNIIIGYNGSTYINYNKNNSLMVFGSNIYGELGIHNEIICMILHNWNININYISNDIISLISKFGCSIKICKKNKFNPFIINNIYSIKHISNGISSSHKFIITNINNKLYGVGKNNLNQLGIGIDNKNKYNWTEILYFKYNNIKLKSIHCASTYSTFLSNNGKIYVCGYSRNGGLGIKKKTLLKLITKINTLSTTKINNISCGYDHTLALDKNGYIYSWGRNRYFYILYIFFIFYYSNNI